MILPNLLTRMGGWPKFILLKYMTYLSCFIWSLFQLFTKFLYAFINRSLDSVFWFFLFFLLLFFYNCMFKYLALFFSTLSILFIFISLYIKSISFFIWNGIFNIISFFITINITIVTLRIFISLFRSNNLFHFFMLYFRF